MPLLVLIALAAAAGAVAVALSRRYPSPMVEQAPVQAATATMESQSRRHPWLRRILRGRLDPRTATGLALTVALAVVAGSGFLIGVLAYLTRSSDTLVDLDTRVGRWGVDHATDWSTAVLGRLTDLGDTWFCLALAVVVVAVEAMRAPNRWLPVFLATVILGNVVLVNTIKELLDRVRPTFDPIAETLGPSFPSGHSAMAASFWAAVALLLARRRDPRTRALLTGAAVAIAVTVAGSRVLLGVHWLSDVFAGVAFGWAWFAICSIAFGGRLIRFGAPVAAAARDVSRHQTS